MHYFLWDVVSQGGGFHSHSCVVLWPDQSQLDVVCTAVVGSGLLFVLYPMEGHDVKKNEKVR